MRVRNNANAKKELVESEIVESNPQAYQGKWNDYLKKAKIHLEIGSGKGGYISQMSTMYPDIGWIAVEKNATIASLALKKLQLLTNKNFVLLNIDAEAIEQYFGKHEVDVIHLNFSDPWPKKRASKRRLSHPKFLKQYETILKSEGVIIMKSDNYDLFVYSLNSFVENGWEIVDVDTDFRSSVKEDAITEYEQKFIDRGQKINRVIVRRKL